MKKFSCFLFKLISLCLIFSMAHAKPMKAPLDKIIFQVATEKWVQTTDAKVIVAVNATLSDTDLVKMRKTLLDKINQIAQADWHITRFDRRQNQSGLENVYITAESRIAEADLAPLREHAKKLSQSGENYSISTIDFTPSLAATEAVREQARSDIYNQVNAEVKRLNQIYPNQHYSVYRINFLPHQYYKARYAQKARSMAMLESADVSSSIKVSQKVVLTASVAIAANRDMTKPTDNQ